MTAAKPEEVNHNERTMDAALLSPLCKKLVDYIHVEWSRRVYDNCKTDPIRVRFQVTAKLSMQSFWLVTVLP